MITEAYATPEELEMYYGRTPGGGAHFPFNFQLTSADNKCDGKCLSKLVTDWMKSLPANASANWVVREQKYFNLRHARLTTYFLYGCQTG